MAGNRPDYWKAKERLEDAQRDVDGKHANSKIAQRELEEAKKEARRQGVI